MIPLRRSGIISIARSWLGTPFRYQASIKGLGADCAAMVLEIYRKYTSYTDVYAYKNYGFKPDFNKTVSMLEKFSYARLHKDYILPGDVILYCIRDSPHFGVLTDCDTIIQSNTKVRKYVEVTYMPSDLIHSVYRV